MNKIVEINFYSVPNTTKVSGGSRTRIRNVIKVLKTGYSSHIINGGSLNKLKGSLFAPKSKVLYVESSTNRLKLVDVFCLIILFFKSDTRYIYIRDIYIELFPDEYNTFRKKITRLFNKLTNRFYAYFANTLCFPTKEMADSFYDFHSKFPIKKIFVFPPGIVNDYGVSTKKEENNFPKLNREISFLYLGGTKYFNSGFDNFLTLARELTDSIFYIITNDNVILEKAEFNNVVLIHDLEHKEVLKFINTKNITFAIHTRPRNKYDDLTFPIKILDFLAVKLPVITLKHIPLKSILPKNYPYFCNEISSKEINDIIIRNIQNPELYNQTRRDIQSLKNNLNYTNKFKEILES